MLVKIDERAVREGVAGSVAQVNQAKAALDEAKANLERQKQLFQQNHQPGRAGFGRGGLKSALAAFNTAQAGSGAAATTQVAPPVIRACQRRGIGSVCRSRRYRDAGQTADEWLRSTDLRVLATIPQARWNEVRGAGAQLKPSLNKWNWHHVR